MTEAELIEAFESTSLPAEQFTHQVHVRVAWAYLRRSPLPDALAAFAAALKGYAAAHGAAGKYHETITVAWMLLIAVRIADTPHSEWTEFAVLNPDLLQRHPFALARYYSPATLASDRARRAFVMPDVSPLVSDATTSELAGESSEATRTAVTPPLPLAQHR